ncbi:amidohydrolase family protein [Bradyrhizobium sp. JR7.2]|uniref:amidohydrolase family protein n=1 Tax=Bradyrhizobium sp. JR7.2 TaxID=3156375 RepID=UPI00339A8C50
MIGLGIADALTTASRTPATFLGLESQFGSIAPGYRADLVAFSSKFEITETWIAGRSSQGEQSM